MRTVAIFLLIVGAVGIFTTAQADTFADTLNQTLDGWQFKGEFMMLQRNDPKKEPIAYNYDIGEIVLDNTDAALDWSSGARFTALKNLNSSWDMEFSYMQMQEWTGRASIVNEDEDLDPAGRLAGFNSGGNFGDSAMYEIESSSEIKQFELNFINHADCINSGLSILGGLRYVYIKEEFNIWSFDELPLDGYLGQYNAWTRNQLFGAQVGLIQDFNLNDKWQLSLIGKAGIYWNRMDYGIYNYNDNSDDFEDSDAQDGVSGVYELGVNTSYALNSNVKFGAGYNMFWFTNVAVAAEQYNRNIDNNGDIFLHGPSAYVLFTW